METTLIEPYEFVTKLPKDKIFTIEPLNINLIPLKYLNQNMYIFKVKIFHKNDIFIYSNVDIVCHLEFDNSWTLVKLDNYINLSNKSYLENHSIIHKEVMEVIQKFDNIFDNKQRLIDNKIFNFFEYTVKLVRIRQSKTTVICKVVLESSNTKIVDLIAIFKIEQIKLYETGFILDVFEYDNNNWIVSEFLDQYGAALRLVLNDYVKYIRIKKD